MYMEEKQAKHFPQVVQELMRNAKQHAARAVTTKAAAGTGEAEDSKFSSNRR
jgi:hypothetical protein